MPLLVDLEASLDEVCRDAIPGWTPLRSGEHDDAGVDMAGSYTYLTGLCGDDVVITHGGIGLDTTFDVWRVDGDELRHERNLVLDVANVQSAVTDSEDEVIVVRSVKRDGALGYVLERLLLDAGAAAWSRSLDERPDDIILGDDVVVIATTNGAIHLRRADGVELARDPRRSPWAWDVRLFHPHLSAGFDRRTTCSPCHVVTLREEIGRLPRR